MIVFCEGRKLIPLSANPPKWPKTQKTTRQQKPTNCLSVFDHFVGLVLKGLLIRM